LDANDRSELKSIEEATTLLMPHNYDNVLTPRKYDDLLAMLARQVTLNLHKRSKAMERLDDELPFRTCFISRCAFAPED
jgi:hypothetical protein